MSLKRRYLQNQKAVVDILSYSLRSTNWHERDSEVNVGRVWRLWIRNCVTINLLSPLLISHCNLRPTVPFHRASFEQPGIARQLVRHPSDNSRSTYKWSYTRCNHCADG